MKILTLPKYLKLTAFDISTEQGRSNERYRLAALTVVANMINRGLAMLVMVLTVSFTVPYLGAERFGVWMTIASFVGMLTFLDLGVGNALTNKVAHAAAQDNTESLRRTISGGLGFLFLLGCGMGLALIGLSSILPWESLIKVGNPLLHEEIRQAAILFSGLFGLHIFANGVQRIFAGLQRAFEGHLVSAAGSILTLILLWVATQKESDIPVLLAVTMGVQSVASLLLLLLLIKRNQLNFLRLFLNIREESHHLLRVGGLFFLLQIGVMVGWGADSLIISSNLGAEQVAVFAIVQRLFQLATQPMSMLNAPLWGAYADAHARGEKQFIKKTLRTSLVTTFSYGLSVSILIVIFGGGVAKIWTGNSIHIPLALFVIYGCWVILEVTGNSLAMFLNGCGIVKQQVITVVVFSTVSIIVKFFMITSYGLEAMILGAVLTYAIITLAAYGWFFRKELLSTMN